VSSIKGSVGHSLGAAGAVELLATLFAACRDHVPPTHGLEVPDPACDLDYVPGVGRHMPVDLALSISVGMGGGNAAIIVRGEKPASAPARLPAGL
jgi:3-oxoacyl-[acyl-carrier-protein] synthase II